MPAAARILVADDDPQIREVVSVLLGADGYTVEPAESGELAVALVQAEDPAPFDLIILDVLMPGMSGFEACEEIRRTSMAPVLFLTAKSREVDKVRGLMAGGDDYLSKPFSFAELRARIRAMLRRYRKYGGASSAETVPPVINVGDIEIDERRRAVTRAGVPVDLTDVEYSVLAMLAERRGSVLTARQIYESVWDDLYLPQSGNTVSVHIRNLRKKLEDDPKNPRYVRTVWGRGYTVG
jgi:DNA-binding response OmpR family regulator